MADYVIYDLAVTAVTPLHIGSGRDLLHEYDYAIKKGKTWRIDETELLAAQDVEDAALADQLASTPPVQLLRDADYREDSPFFRYVLNGAPRSTGRGAQLREQLKDVRDRPYLPGSSLKGAIRTALGWQLWADLGLKPEMRRLGRRREWAASDYEREIYGPDPNHDLMRALQIGDSAPLGAADLMIVNARVMGRFGKLGSPIELEAIKPDASLKMTLKLDRALFSQWAARAQLSRQGGDRLVHLTAVAQAYTEERIARERAWFGDIQGAERVESFYAQLERAKLGHSAFLLQVGWGAGWESKTFGTRLTGDKVFMERMISEYRLARGDRKPGDPFPKSRRVAVAFERNATGARETPAYPFGWVLVQMRERA